MDRVTGVYWRCGRRQKQPEEFWSVQGYALCPDSVKWSKVDWAALHSTNEQWAKTYSKSNQEFLKVKKWNIVQWPSKSPDFNRIEHAFHLLKTERPTNNKWSQLQQRPDKASERRKPILRWCPWSPDLSEDSQQNIKNKHFIYYYIYLSNYIWAPENGGTVYKKWL